MAEPIKEVCGTCKFFATDGLAKHIGGCRFYPTVVFKMTLDWCGQWKIDDKKDESDEQQDDRLPIGESDDDFRKRIWDKIGHATVNEDRLRTASGAKVDEIGSFYGMKRK